MTLVSVEDPDREVHLTGILRRKYEWLVVQLGDDLAPIEETLDGMINGDRIHTADWMPGSDWSRTPFQRIYEVCGDEDEPAKCFGLIVWKVFEKRPETWAGAHGMGHGREIRSRTYFRWPMPQVDS